MIITGQPMNLAFNAVRLAPQSTENLSIGATLKTTDEQDESLNVPIVLIADDSEDDRIVLQHAARAMAGHFLLQFVEDGREVIDYLSGRGPYSDRHRFPFPVLLLLDIKMPLRDGFQVLEWLRQQPSLKSLPVAMLSSSYDSIDVNRAYDLEANWYFAKPPGFDGVVLLMRLIREWIANPHQRHFSQSPDFQPRLD
jgi:CheY-like chemotaxis protein